MEQKPITLLDGTEEQREEIMKNFFGLRPDQSFQDIDIDDEEKIDNANGRNIYEKKHKES